MVIDVAITEAVPLSMVRQEAPSSPLTDLCGSHCCSRTSMMQLISCSSCRGTCTLRLIFHASFITP